MAPKLGVLVIHGIGEQKENFAAGLVAEVSKRLGVRAREVAWQPVWWAPLIEPAETELLARLSAGNDLDYRWLRQFVVHFLADAVAYQRVPGESAHPGLYVRIHDLVALRLRELRAALRVGLPPGAPDAPLVVLAHSLGGHIMSDYIWDHQHTQDQRALGTESSPFERAETLTGLVTFGCNIPLFALALPAMIPITFPPTTLTPQLMAAARWLNLYDPDDVLGYPLKPLSAEYAKAVTEDRAVNVGGLLTSWNPASHNQYWTDNDVTKPIAALLETLLERC